MSSNCYKKTRHISGHHLF